jgi:hypothetical protein
MPRMHGLLPRPPYATLPYPNQRLPPLPACLPACLLVAGVGLSHLTGEVRRIMGLITKYDQDNYPESLGHICIINAPSLFRMVWSVVKGMLDPRTQSKIEVRVFSCAVG